jgi:hypothetical protein
VRERAARTLSDLYKRPRPRGSSFRPGTRRLDPHVDTRVVRRACLASATEVCDRDRWKPSYHLGVKGSDNDFRRLQVGCPRGSRLTGVDIERCPVCQQGRLHIVAILAPTTSPTQARGDPRYLMRRSPLHVTTLRHPRVRGARWSSVPMPPPPTSESHTAPRLRIGGGNQPLAPSAHPASVPLRCPRASSTAFHSARGPPRIPIAVWGRRFSSTGFLRHARRTTDKGLFVMRTA